MELFAARAAHAACKAWALGQALARAWSAARGVGPADGFWEDWDGDAKTLLARLELEGGVPAHLLAHAAMRAAWRGRLDSLALLLAAGHDPATADESGKTALMRAAKAAKPSAFGC